MIHPSPTKVPSESTIEQLANHQLLNLVGAYSTWFYVPTRNEERYLGYDASLQDAKALVIQYKRFIPHASREGGAIKISARQHSTLLANFPKAATPYVFYGFCTLRTYADIESCFRHGTGWMLGAHLAFIDAHSIRPGTARLSWVTLSSSSVSLFQLAHDFLRCSSGLRATLIEGIVQRAESNARSSPHLSIMIGTVPSL